MGLDLVGTLPVAAINIGLLPSIATLSVQVAAIGTDIAKLTLLIPQQIAAHLAPPNVAAIAIGIQAQILALPLTLNPATFASLGASYSSSLGVQLGITVAQELAVGLVVNGISAAINTGGLMAWSYSGRAANFGSKLAAQTATGVGGQGANDSIQGIVIATESFATWGSFSLTFNTGASSAARATSTRADLRFMGKLTGAQLNTGVASIFLTLENFLKSLTALRLSLTAQIQVTFGLNLPDPQALISVLANIDPVQLMTGYFLFNVNLLAEIEVLVGRITVLLGLAADLAVSLSGGGLSVWKYNGSVAGLGTGLQGALAEGLPGGTGKDAPAYGLAIAAASPAAWAAFGVIFGG